MEIRLRNNIGKRPSKAESIQDLLEIKVNATRFLKVDIKSESIKSENIKSEIWG